MRQAANPLTPEKAAELLAVGKTGTYAIGDRLYLTVTSPGRGSWALRYNSGTRTSAAGKVYARTREMGLGAAGGPDRLSFEEAREKAAAVNRLIRDGIDPLDNRDAEARALEEARRQAEAEREKARPFRATVAAFFAQKRSRFDAMSAVNRHQWHQTIDDYALPVIGDMPTNAIDLDAMERVLAPIWSTKNETANRLRSRLQAVIDFAIAKRWHNGPNPARWDGPLAHILDAEDRHQRQHASLPWREMPAFMAALRAQPGVAARALEMLILSGCRTNEVRAARWSEIDLAERIWTVPPDRVKTSKKNGRRPHLVPLCGAAVALLERMALARREEDEDPFVFPGGVRGEALSDGGMAALIKRMNGAGAAPRWIDPTDNRPITAHGMRAAFRTWADEAKEARTRFSHAAKEQALGHLVGTKVERAYARGQLFDERRELMEAWAEYCGQAPADVVPLRRSAG